MNKLKCKQFLEAVDIVCINCIKLNEETCEHCPVRITADVLRKKYEERTFDIKIGCEYTFDTVDEEMTKYNGTKVVILHQKSEHEYVALFNNGHDYEVFDDELHMEGGTQQ